MYRDIQYFPQGILVCNPWLVPIACKPGDVANAKLGKLEKEEVALIFGADALRLKMKLMSANAPTPVDQQRSFNEKNLLNFLYLPSFNVDFCWNDVWVGCIDHGMVKSSDQLTIWQRATIIKECHQYRFASNLIRIDYIDNESSLRLGDGRILLTNGDFQKL